VLNAITLLHEGATWHQNIGPDEILLTPFGPVLLGFGSAAHAIEAMKHTPAAALKPGYAAIEQYGSAAGTTRGPWTDLYGLAAVVYGAITGADPPPAADRLTEDRMRPLSTVAAGLYSERFLAAIDAAMAVQPRRRPADHAEFRALMGDIEAPEAVSLAPPPDLMQQPFAGAPDRDRETTVPDRPASANVAAPATPSPATTPQAAAAPARSATAAATGNDGAPDAPSWMRAAQARGIGKRALYGVIAGTCALIGIAALVVQFATRPPPRAPAASAARTAPAAAVPGPTAAPATTPLATPAQKTAIAPATATATLAPVAKPATQAPARLATTAPAAKTPATTTATPPRAAPPTARAQPAAAPAIVAATPAERQARCTEILQKASLEKITPAETDFFKRECK
ncbi:MAG: hypothetical protein ACXWUL_08185, partial [Caldimonas sp.]